MTTYDTGTAFNKAFEAYNKKTIPTILIDVQKIVTTEIFKRIVQRTPVLTGRARRNWIPTLNAPTDESTEEVAGVAVTGEPMTAGERDTINRITNGLHIGNTFGTTIWITNNLPYINRLENGYSAKAPDGIVEGAILGALEMVRSRGIVISRAGTT